MKGLPAIRIVASLVLGCLLLLSFPYFSLQAESRRRRERQGDAAKVKLANEILNIYALLKSNEVPLSDGALLKVSKTIAVESRKYSLDPLLVLAIMKVESRFRTRAVSLNGARGLMQILPSVAHALSEELEIKVKKGAKGLDDPIINIKLGIYYLAQLKEQFPELRHTLAAYHSGPSSIKARLAKKQPIPSDYPRKVILAYRNYREQDVATG